MLVLRPVFAVQSSDPSHPIAETTAGFLARTLSAGTLNVHEALGSPGDSFHLQKQMRGQKEENGISKPTGRYSSASIHQLR